MAISGANEVYKKVSPLVEQQFPEYIRENGPRFVAFMEAYYEYMEQTGKAGYAIRTLNDNQDIDRTVVEFVEYFRREYALSIPKSALADKRLVVKHIREFYRSRGSQKSFKFLFHILFGSEVNFYYPGDDILRTSDGRWIRETVLTVEKQSGNITLLDGRTVTGQTSGAIGRIQNIIVLINLGVEVFKLTIENVTGEFVDKELVTDGFGNTVRVKADIGGVATQTISDGGVFNVIDDTVELVGETSGSAAEGKVTKIENSTALTFTISKGGSGYRTGINSIFDIGSSGPGSITPVLRVISLSNTSQINIFTDVINSVKNVVLNGNLPTSNVGLTFSALGSNSTTLSSNLASATIYSIIGAKLAQGDVLVGSINAISILSPGRNYTSMPTVSVVDQDTAAQGLVGQNGKVQGRDAVIVPNFAPGAIAEIEVTSNGEDADFILGETINITNTRTSAIDTITLDDSTFRIPRHVLSTVRNGTSSVLSITGIQKLTGRYLGTKGFLSWNNRIQDNYYYQEFSYVLKSPNLIDAYRDVVQNLLHTAGTKMFGSYEIVSQPNMQISVASSVSEIIFESNFLAFSLEDNNGYLRIENPISKFLLEDNSGDILISQDSENIIEEQFDTNFVALIEQETPAVYKRDSIKEIITPTDIFTGGVITSASVFETSGTVTDISSQRVTKEVNIFETSGTPADLETAVYSGTPAVLETSTPVDLQPAGATRLTAVLESGVTPADLETAVYSGTPAVLESGVTPVDRETAVYSGTPAVLETSTPVDLQPAGATRLTAVLESGVTPADLETAVYSGTPAVLESGVTPADLETAVYSGTPAVLESGVTPVDRETAGANRLSAVLETSTPVDLQPAGATRLTAVLESGVTPVDLETQIVTKEVNIYESGGTPADLETAVVFNLSTTTGQSTGFVRVVYGNTQISTFSKDTVNVFKAVQIQTMTDLDGIPRLVLVTSPDIGRNLDRQANGNFGNGSIVSTTTVRIIPAAATFTSNTNLYTVSTIYSNSFLTLTSDYTPTTANARMYWVT
jgi:hypothetical protein